MKRKIIPIPGAEVDVTRVLPILYHPHMARLQWLEQLGGVQPGFPGGRHSRLEHALGTFASTMTRAERWAAEGTIGHDDVLPLAVAGLVHDIGHPALSHVLEGRLETDHHANGELRLREMRRVFDEIGCDVERVIRLLDKSPAGDPLGTAVTDRYLGTDKMDYLWRDAFHAGVETPGMLRFVESRLHMTTEGLAVDTLATCALRALLLAQQSMYGDFYLRKSSRIAQAFMGRMFGFMLAENVISRNEPFSMTDDEFHARMWRAKSPEVTQMRERRRRLDLPKTVLVYRWENGMDEERIADKPIRVIGGESRHLDDLATLQDEQCDEIADAIADELRIPRHLTLFVKPAEIDRMVPHFVLLSDGDKTRSLAERSPDFFCSMERTAFRYQVARVCVPTEYRERCFEQADKIDATVVRELYW